MKRQSRIFDIYKDWDRVSRKSISPIRNILKSQDDKNIKIKCVSSILSFWILSIGGLMLFSLIKNSWCLISIPIGFIVGLFMMIVNRIKYSNHESVRILAMVYVKYVFSILGLAAISFILYYLCTGLGS